MPSRKKTQFKPPPANQAKKGARKHSTWRVICNGGPSDDQRLRIDVYPWHEKARGETGGLPAVVKYDFGRYVLNWDSNPKSVTFEWEDST